MEIPAGISCTFSGKTFTASKGSLNLERIINIPSVKVEIRGNKIILTAEKGNKNELKFIKTNIAHIKNLFSGLDNKYTYRLEACNVHFPMTLKVEPHALVINNFLGEKVPRRAVIPTGAEVEVKGLKITITSHDKEAAGKAATNIEKATKIRNRDRRIFQDGIFITEKPIGVAK